MLISAKNYTQCIIFALFLAVFVIPPQVSFAWTTIFTKDKVADTHTETFATHSVPSTFQLDGTLDGVEEITFELVGINGVDVEAWVDEYGDAIKFTATVTRPIPVYSPIDVKITKPVTANNVGVKLVQ